MNLRKRVKAMLRKRILTRTIQQERAREEEIILAPVPREYRKALTETEKQAVRELWQPITKKLTVNGQKFSGGGISFQELSIFKYFNGFDPRYLGHELYLPLVAHLLNNYHYTKFFEDKGLLGVMSGAGLRFPYCVLRCVDGEFYDDRMQQLSAAEARRKCLAYEGAVVQKIARESSGGHGVQKFLLTGSQAEKERVAEKIFGLGERDWVLQRAIEQHPVMARFNPSSLNTFRIITLYLHGRATLCYVLLRVGQAGSFVDNMCSGGVGIGVEPDGKLHDVGYTYALEQVREHNGVVLAGESIPQLPRVIERVLAAHEKCYPAIKLIGWDVCLAADGEPTVVEINASQPEIFVGQLNCGPVFGERTEEVIDYCASRDFCYHRALLTY